MKKIAKYLTFAALLAASSFAFGQEIKKNLRPFNKITVSPKINLILQKGSEESIRITYSNIDPAKINVVVEGNKLSLYLDQARLVDKRERTNDDYDYDSKTSIYKNAEVTAYVTYTRLSVLEVRGNQEVTCHSVIDANDFILRAYGEAEITLDTLQAKNLKVVAYGENKIKLNGIADHQRYALYGENKINGRGLQGSTISTSLCGEGRLQVNASDEVKINAIGEPEIEVHGTSMINKGFIIGKTDIRSNHGSN